MIASLKQNYRLHAQQRMAIRLVWGIGIDIGIKNRQVRGATTGRSSICPDTFSFSLPDDTPGEYEESRRGNPVDAAFVRIATSPTEQKFKVRLSCCITQ